MEVDGWVVLNWLVGQKKPPPLVAVPSLSATKFTHPLPPIIIGCACRVNGDIAQHCWGHHPPGSLASVIVPFLACASGVGFLAGKEAV